MALTPQEQQIMDLRDDGLTSGKIARRLGLKPNSVAKICNMYSDDIVADRRRASRLRSGSADLRNAIQAAGGHR